MIKTDIIPLTNEERNAISKYVMFWFADTLVSGTKKPLFLDKDGDEIARVTGYDIIVSYEVENE